MPRAPIYGRVNPGGAPLGVADYNVESPGPMSPSTPAPAIDPSSIMRKPNSTAAAPMTPTGLLGGGAYDPNNPFGNLSNTGRGNFGDIARGLIGKGGAAGAFDPNFLRNMLRRRAIMSAAARNRRSALLAHLVGADPTQSREALLNSDIESSGQLAGDLNNAELSGYQGYQDWIRSMFGNERGIDAQRQAQREAERAAQRGQLSGMIGELAGTVLPGFLPGRKP